MRYKALFALGVLLSSQELLAVKDVKFSNLGITDDEIANSIRPPRPRSVGDLITTLERDGGLEELEDVDVSSNVIGLKGATDILKALLRNAPLLRRLDFSWNQIDAYKEDDPDGEEFEKVLKLLVENENFREINFQHNGIAQERWVDRISSIWERGGAEKIIWRPSRTRDVGSSSAHAERYAPLRLKVFFADQCIQMSELGDGNTELLRTILREKLGDGGEVILKSSEKMGIESPLYGVIVDVLRELAGARIRSLTLEVSLGEEAISMIGRIGSLERLLAGGSRIFCEDYGPWSTLSYLTELDLRGSWFAQQSWIDKFTKEGPFEIKFRKLLSVIPSMAGLKTLNLADNALFPELPRNVERYLPVEIYKRYMKWRASEIQESARGLVRGFHGDALNMRNTRLGGIFVRAFLVGIEESVPLRMSLDFSRNYISEEDLFALQDALDPAFNIVSQFSQMSAYETWY